MNRQRAFQEGPWNDFLPVWGMPFLEAFRASFLMSFLSSLLRRERGQKPPETLLVHFHACLDHGVAAQLQVRALGFVAVLYKALAHGKAQLLLQTQVCALRLSEWQSLDSGRRDINVENFLARF